MRRATSRHNNLVRLLRSMASTALAMVLCRRPVRTMSPFERPFRGSTAARAAAGHALLQQSFEASATEFNETAQDLVWQCAPAVELRYERGAGTSVVRCMTHYRESAEQPGHEVQRLWLETVSVADATPQLAVDDEMAAKSCCSATPATPPLAVMATGPTPTTDGADSAIGIVTGTDRPVNSETLPLAVNDATSLPATFVPLVTSVSATVEDIRRVATKVKCGRRACFFDVMVIDDAAIDEAGR
jgi:hypothetical protein